MSSWGCPDRFWAHVGGIVAALSFEKCHCAYDYHPIKLANQSISNPKASHFNSFIEPRSFDPYKGIRTTWLTWRGLMDRLASVPVVGCMADKAGAWDALALKGPSGIMAAALL